MAIERKDQERLVTVYVNTSGRDVGSIVPDLRARLRALPVPAGFTLQFTGEWEQQRENFRELAISILLSLLLIYMVMAGQYESLRDPFVVMFSIPLSSIGVLLMLFFTGTTFNIQTWIGVLMLGGIVVNNAILLVDTMNLLRRRDGLGLREAVQTAGSRRLRPVLMTSLTTIVGLLPLALGLGEGGEMQAPLARTVIGGLTSSTFITLLFIPCLYLLFERRREARRLTEAKG
jgi:HAE1 family hydrophobic/amphiphilic exporter-1